MKYKMFKTVSNLRIVSLHWLVLLHHLLLGFGVFYYGIDWIYVVGLGIYAYVMQYFIGKIGHYKFAHSKYKSTFTNYLYSLYLIFFSSLGSPLSMIARHRQHHKYADTEFDPHSPKQIGWWRVYFLFWKPQNVSISTIRDFARCKFQKFLHKHWVKLHLGFCCLVGFIDISVLIFAVSLIQVVSFHVGSMQNLCGHLFGKPRNAIANTWYDILYFICLLGPEGWRHADHHENGYEGNFNLFRRVNFKRNNV